MNSSLLLVEMVSDWLQLKSKMEADDLIGWTSSLNEKQKQTFVQLVFKCVALASCIIAWTLNISENYHNDQILLYSINLFIHRPSCLGLCLYFFSFINVSWSFAHLHMHKTVLFGACMDRASNSLKLGLDWPSEVGPHLQRLDLSCTGWASLATVLTCTGLALLFMLNLTCRS